MIKVIKDSKEDIYNAISEKLNEIGFKVLTKAQDYQKDLHIRIQSKDKEKNEANLEQSKENVKNILNDLSKKYNFACKFNLVLKDTNFIEGSIEVKEKINDRAYEYFGTEKLKQLARSGEAELLKSEGKNEYNDEYYIVLNNKKEKLLAESDKEAIKQFKNLFKKKILATDSIEKNTDVENFLSIILDKLLEVNEACDRANKYIESLTADTREETKLYKEVINYLDNMIYANEMTRESIKDTISDLKSAHVKSEQALYDFGESIEKRLQAGENLRDLMQELETIYNSIPNKEELEGIYDGLQSKLLRANNAIARKKLKARNSQ